MKKKDVIQSDHRCGKIPWQMLVLLLLLSGGVSLAWHTVRQADREMREDLLEKARGVSSGIDVDCLRSLSGTDADLSNPLYSRLKNQLAAVRSANPDYRFLYFMGRKADGSIFFYIDSESANSEYYSPPGQVYTEASENMQNAFSTQEDTAEGPNVDRWGTWVSALIPILDTKKIQHGRATRDEAYGIVREAIAFYKKNGRDRFLKEVNDPKGEFYRGDLYVFAYDQKMTMLAHPVKPEMVGQNLLNKKDWSGGKYFRKEMQKVALSKGDGWVEYEYENPVTKQRESKTTYVERVNDIIVCAGAGSGELVALMGIDIDARVWKWLLFRSAIPPILLTLTLVILLLTGGILLVHRSKIPGKPPSWMMRLEPALAVAVGLVLTLFMAWVFHHSESRISNNFFYHMAADQTDIVAKQIVNLGDYQLKGLEFFFKGSQNVDAGEFLEYTKYLLRNRSVEFWEWVPVVKAEEKGAFEIAARGEGLTGFEIWEKNAKGERVPVSGRSKYYPVFRVAPLASNEASLGFDLGSEPRRRMAIEEAIRTGEFSVSEPIELVQKKGESKGMLFLQPVLKGDGPNRLRGFVGAALMLKSFMNDNISRGMFPTELSLLTKDAEPERLVSVGPIDQALSSGIHVTRYIFAFGKVFAVTAYLGIPYKHLNHLSAWWITLFSGTALSIVIGLVITLLLRRRERLEELVVERTAELRRSEESYRGQFVKNSTVMLLLNPKDGLITDANQAAVNFYGYPPERLLTMRITEINTLPADEVMKRMGLVSPGEGQRFQFEHRLADGSLRDVEVSASYIQFGGRAVVHFIIHDITDRKRIEAALRESEKRFMDVFYASKDALLLLDGSIFADANESAAKMLRYATRQEFLNTHPSQLSPPTQPDGRSSAEKAEEMMRMAVEKGFNQFEWMHRKSNGEDFPAQVSLTPIAFQGKTVLYCVWKDLTEEKRNKALLREKSRQLAAAFEESLKSREILVSMMDDNNEIKVRFERTARKLDLILSSISEGIVGLDTQGLNIFVNAQALKLLGYSSEEEVIGKQSHALCHHSHADGSPYPVEECPSHATLTDGINRHTEDVYWRKDGTSFPVEVSAIPLNEEGKIIGLVITFRDISERKQAELALRQGEERLRSITDSAQDAILMMDTKGVISFWNPAAERIFGYTTQEAAGMNLHTLLAPGRFHPVHEAAYPEFLRSGTGTAIGKTLELAALRKDGVEIAISLSLSAVKRDDGWHAVGLISDITERKRAEMELRKFQRAIEQSPVSVMIADLKGLIDYVNPKFSETSGYSKEEALTQNPRILKSGELTPAVYKELWGTITSGKEWHGEFHNKKKNGALYWESASISPIRDAKGVITHFLAIKEDITKQKESEELMRVMMGELNKARVSGEQATQAKAMFLANMSHEIRTPMNAIIGFSELLRQTALDPEQRNFVDTMHASGQALLELVNDILDFSKIEAGKIDLEEIDFNLEYLCRDAFNSISGKIKRNDVSTFVDFHSDVPDYLRGDPTRIRQILINLLGNAAKFTERGEIGLIVKLSGEVSDSAERIIEFSVKDSGIGISPEKQALLFQRFNQVDMSTTRKYGGTGIGLAICKTLVEKMQGKIWIESKAHEGSEFRFTVKMKLGVSPLEDNLNILDIKNLAGKKVVIIDDIQVAQEITAKYCAAIGLLVAKVLSSAEEGLSYLEESAKAGQFPDVVLSDIRMEKMDGYHFIEKLKALYPGSGMKYIAITSDVWTGAAKESQKRGFHGYLPKPIFKGDLARVIGTVLGDMRGKKKIVTKHTANEIACKGMRVLVVEDTKTNQMLIRSILTKWGCVVEFADNGQEGLDKLRANSYDICLMDLQMPVLGGLEATRILRREVSKDFPVIALTAAALDEDRLKCEEAGMTDFISKPINVDILKEKLIKYARPV